MEKRTWNRSVVQEMEKMGRFGCYPLSTKEQKEQRKEERQLIEIKKKAEMTSYLFSFYSFVDKG